MNELMEPSPGGGQFALEPIDLFLERCDRALCGVPLFQFGDLLCAFEYL
mgnify:CR=1 FL=1